MESLHNCNVCDILHETNYVLFNDLISGQSSVFLDHSLPMATSKQNASDKGATLDTVDEKSPSDADIFSYLKQMDTNIVYI